MAFDNSLFKKAIFSNPMYFLKTCDLLGMFEFNPYEKNTLEQLNNLKGIKYDKRTGKEYDLSKDKLDNPGFAPYIGIANSFANENMYAKVNGYFMEIMDMKVLILQEMEELLVVNQ